MSITAQDIKKISRLARIEVRQEELETLANQVGGIISWVEKLGEVNTDNVEALNSVGEENLRLNKDEISDGNIASDVLKNSAAAKYDYFAVPKVIE
jgi:aspartyl-tRNA(Asn)/glutamyl-tRNA(Gln) amidotransferase subunit C